MPGHIDLFEKLKKFPCAVVEKVTLEVLGLPKSCIESDFSTTFGNKF